MRHRGPVPRRPKRQRIGGHIILDLDRSDVINCDYFVIFRGFGKKDVLRLEINPRIYGSPELIKETSYWACRPSFLVSDKRFCLARYRPAPIVFSLHLSLPDIGSAFATVS